MKTSVKQLSDTKVELSIQVGRDGLENARLAALKQLAKDAKVPGFRNGKAPANVVEKHVDPNKLAEVSLENAVARAVAEGFNAEKIRPLMRPEITVTKYVPGDTLEFRATADILPAIKLGDYKKLKAKTEKVEILDKEITDVLGNIQNSFSEKKAVKRAAKNGDEVLIDFTGKLNGEAFKGGSDKDFPLKLGSKSFIPGFEEGVAGHEPGDKFNLDLEFPADYHAANLKGQKVVFEVLLKQVNELSLPKVDDELAKKCGPFKNVVELKEDVKKNLLAQKTHEAREKLKDALVMELVEKSKVPVPDVLQNDQVEMIKQDMARNLAYRGMSLEDYLGQIKKTEQEWLETDVKLAADKRVKAGLVLAELSKELKIDVLEDEVKAKQAELVTAYSKNPEAMKQLGTDEARIDIRNRLLTDKTIEELIKINKK